MIGRFSLLLLAIVRRLLQLGTDGARGRDGSGGQAGDVARRASDLLPAGAHVGQDGLDALLVDRLDALGADAQRDPTALSGDPEALLLDVRIPPAAGLAMRVRDGVAEAG